MSKSRPDTTTEPFFGEVSAKYIPVLARFAAWNAVVDRPSIAGIWIEPHDGGVVLTASNGKALCSFFDAGGRITRPVRVHLPPDIVAACRKPEIALPHGYDGRPFANEAPGWLRPGTLMVHDIGVAVLAAELPPGADPEDAAQFAHRPVTTGNLWSERDYRVLGHDIPNWRHFTGDVPPSNAPVTLDLEQMSWFAALRDLSPHGMGSLTLLTAAHPNLVVLRSIGVPEFVGIVMPFIDIGVSATRVPAWARPGAVRHRLARIGCDMDYALDGDGDALDHRVRGARSPDLHPIDGV